MSAQLCRRAFSPWFSVPYLPFVCVVGERRAAAPVSSDVGLSPVPSYSSCSARKRPPVVSGAAVQLLGTSPNMMMLRH
jgi:hypothetical protein